MATCSCIVAWKNSMNKESKSQAARKEAGEVTRGCGIQVFVIYVDVCSSMT